MFLFLLQTAQPVWYKDPITVATVVIAVATVVSVFTTYLMWKETRDSVNITRETFEHSIKPIVAVPELIPFNSSENRELVFTVKVENYGNIPAVEVRTTAEIIADGFALQVQKHETGFLLIVPHSHIVTTLLVSGDSYQRAIGSASLAFRFSALYEGVAEKRYQYDFEGVYYPAKNEFVTTKTNSTDLSKK